MANTRKHIFDQTFRRSNKKKRHDYFVENACKIYWNGTTSKYLLNAPDMNMENTYYSKKKHTMQSLCYKKVFSFEERERERKK